MENKYQVYGDAIAKADSDLLAQLGTISPRLFVEFYLRLHPDAMQCDLATKFGMKPQAFSKLLARPTGSFNYEQKQLMADLIAETDFSDLIRDFSSFFDSVLSVQYYKLIERVLPQIVQLHSDYYPDNSFSLRIMDSVLDFQDIRKQRRRLYYFNKSFSHTMDAELRSDPPGLYKEDILCTNNRELAYSAHPELKKGAIRLCPDQVILFSENYDKIIEFFNC